MRIRSVHLVLLLIAGRMLSAQGTRSAQLEGTVTDSVRAKPLVGAWIFLTRRDTEPPALLRAVSDDKGRYRFDNLTPGKYSVGFASEWLDSLDVMLPETSIALATGQRATMDFATPSGATLRAAACPGLALPKGRGAVVGYVVNADDDDRPLANATIVVSWRDVTVDRTTLRATSQERSGAVTTDSTGRYRLCGVPTENFLLVQVQHGGRAGAALRLSVPDDAGLVVQALSLSPSSSRSIAAVDSTRADTPPAPLRGSAELSGVVRAPSGQPLKDAQVRVHESGSLAITDSLGRYSLRELPGGTQILEVKRIGYLVGQVPVQLRSGTPTQQDVRLLRIVNLDSIRVVAQRSRYRDFERNKRSYGGFGRYLTQDDIERTHPIETSDLVRMAIGFRVVGTGLNAKVISSRGSISLLGGQCESNIVIDGMPRQDINLVNARDIGAMEMYRGQTAPVPYESACGTIMIWTKR